MTLVIFVSLCIAVSHLNQPNGAELLCDILNGFFTILVDIVHKYNGDIVKVCCVVLGCLSSYL